MRGSCAFTLCEFFNYFKDRRVCLYVLFGELRYELKHVVAFKLSLRRDFARKKTARNGRAIRTKRFSVVNNAYEVADSIKYMHKYISKNDEKIICSRGLKTYFMSDVLDKDIVCRMGDEEHGFKYILAPNFTCIADGEIIGTVSPEVIEKMPKAN